MKRKLDIVFAHGQDQDLIASTMVMLAFDLVNVNPDLAPSARDFQILERARVELGTLPLASCMHALRECTVDHKLEYVRHVIQQHLNLN